jgi:glutaredoxin/glutathione-dependent peroxiredoxin
MSPGLTLIPSVTFQTMENGKPRSITSREVFSGRNVALFGVLGAFTPACHYIHLPEIAVEFERYKASGIDLVALTAVNDIYVLEAWRRSLRIPDDILFLADGNGDFAKSLGLIFDGRKLGLGVRSKRYAMWIRNGTIQHLSVDPDPTQADVSSAYSLLRVFESWSESA